MYANRRAWWPCKVLVEKPGICMTVWLYVCMSVCLYFWGLSMYANRRAWWPCKVLVEKPGICMTVCLYVCMSVFLGTIYVCQQTCLVTSTELTLINLYVWLLPVTILSTKWLTRVWHPCIAHLSLFALVKFTVFRCFAAFSCLHQWMIIHHSLMKVSDSYWNIWSVVNLGWCEQTYLRQTS